MGYAGSKSDTAPAMIVYQPQVTSSLLSKKETRSSFEWLLSYDKLLALFNLILRVLINRAEGLAFFIFFSQEQFLLKR